MSGVWGNKIKYSIFGESHGNGIGIVIDGLEPGIELDLDAISKEMERRAPGKNKLSTSRNEKDQFEILSGVFQDKTTGAPLCAIIRNSNQHSKDYSKTKDLIRPGHADYTGRIKYNDFNDYRGGGHFSGRITAPLVFAGAVAKQALLKKGIIIGSHIYSIKNIKDDKFDLASIKEDSLKELTQMDFPVIRSEKSSDMKDEILKAREEQDSVGGIIECAAINLPCGIGSPYFDSIESSLSHLLFSIPAVKGVEFGLGFEITELFGSKANDEYYIEDDVINTYTNNNGGVLGGITNGMPLVFRVAIKPTPSIAKSQRTVDMVKRENANIEVHGRHDPCIVQRAIPVVEAVTAMGILEHI
ncbi:chorismate synthase [Clostridium grantii]|uniref:Chorismate synthase n=1 Tax=Clostridium grantii DSM 8605 TaxID=1121316 RepID=A0A1M5WM08_9CLOT|nr:chorismate synthase [Clostridium grantii]SHH88214.1 chorismate synthase [Clostridium grantii DSM 8605]